MLYLNDTAMEILSQYIFVSKKKFWIKSTIKKIPIHVLPYNVDYTVHVYGQYMLYNHV